MKVNNFRAANPFNSSLVSVGPKSYAEIERYWIFERHLNGWDSINERSCSDEIDLDRSVVSAHVLIVLQKIWPPSYAPKNITLKRIKQNIADEFWTLSEQ